MIPPPIPRQLNAQKGHQDKAAAGTNQGSISTCAESQGHERHVLFSGKYHRLVFDETHLETVLFGRRRSTRYAACSHADGHGSPPK